LSQDFRGRGRPWGIFIGFYKTRHILQSDSANCTVLRAVVLTQYRRVTDRHTDGIAIDSTTLAMRALPRAVKTRWILLTCTGRTVDCMNIVNCSGHVFSRKIGPFWG